jgi:tetratricopeptide (TPR) repeat protein
MQNIKQLNDNQSLQTLTDTEALRSSELARQFAEKGDYDTARNELGYYWQGIGQRPRIDGLHQFVQAEILLRVGSLTGWIGSAQNIDGSQESAKNLLTESVELFENLGDLDKASEAYVDLAICYCRCGALEESRVILEQILATEHTSPHQRARAILNLSIVDWMSERQKIALDYLLEAESLFQSLNTYYDLQGRYRGQLALHLRSLGYIDRAIIEYTEASYNFEQSGNIRSEASVVNNLGYIYFKLGKPLDAHVHFDRARKLFNYLKDRVKVASVDDSRAQVLLSQSKLNEAKNASRSAVLALENGDEQAIAAEALTTYGQVLSRLGEYPEAQAAFDKALNYAEVVGANKVAGLACLVRIEELGDYLTLREIVSFYMQADMLLEKVDEPDILQRLRMCARQVTQSLPQLNDDLNLNDQAKFIVKCFQERAIKRALKESDGRITETARRLGLSHQTLKYKLENQNEELLADRKPPRKRYRSIIKK